MKFSIERAALLKAVAQAQSVVERRNTIPILANVLIERVPRRFLPSHSTRLFASCPTEPWSP